MSTENSPRLPDELNHRPGSRWILRIPRWCGFWVSAPLLVISVLIEGVHGIIAAIHFFFSRKRQREKFKAMLLDQGRRLAGALVLAVCALFLQVGCTSFPGASFGDQVDQLNWSVAALTSSGGSMEDGLLDFHTMFIGDLSSDRLRETFEQLGW